MAEWISIDDRSHFPAFGEPCFVRCEDGLTIAAASKDARGKVTWHRVGSELCHVGSMGWTVSCAKASWQVHPTHFQRFPSS
jgi:hypothetical protein